MKGSQFFVQVVGILLFQLFIAAFTLLSLFLIAVASEIMMPFVSSDRRPVVERGYFANSPQYGWRLIPNLQVELRSYGSEEHRQKYFSTDSKGFRSTPVFRDNSPTGVVLGDSIVQGYFLTDQESLPWQLAQEMNSNVVNAGVGGYSTDQELMMFDEIVAEHEKIDWAVLVFFANDLPYNLTNSAWGLHKPRFDLKDGGRRVDFQSVVAMKTANPNHPSHATPMIMCCSYDQKKMRELIIRRFLEYYYLTPNPADLAIKIRNDFRWVWPLRSQYKYQMDEEFYRNPDSHIKEWRIAFDIIEKMADISNQKGIKFFVVYMPEIAQLLNRDGIGEKNKPQTYFMKRCAKSNLTCLDPTDLFAANPTKMYVMDDGHLSPQGAATLSHFIKNQIHIIK